MLIEQKKLLHNLHLWLTIIAALIVIGILFIYSSSSVFALEMYGSSGYFVKRHLWGLGIGVIGLFIFRSISLHIIQIISPYFFFSTLLLSALTLTSRFGVHIHGSSRWLRLGSITFQPSELLKIAFVIYIAYFLDKKEGQFSSFSKSYLPFLCIISITCLVLLQQPDFGMSVTLATTAFMLYFIMHSTSKHLMITALALIPITIGLIITKPYRVKRILTFLNPWEDPRGAGFQIIQSLIALGSGSWFGTGISHSKQKFFYLPMQHTDFIFSIIAEETGFVGSTLLITLYMLFLYFGIRIAWYTKDTFHMLITLGFVLLTTLQAFINIAVATGLAPTKGIGLPFISYGNSSLIATLCMVGLIINCVEHARH